MPAVGAAQAPAGYAVNARLDVDEARVGGAMHIAVDVAEGQDTVALWLLTDRLREPPSYLNEENARWIYPGQVDVGVTSITEVRVDGVPVTTEYRRRPSGELRGCDFAGADMLVPIVPGRARRVGVRLRFEVDLPARFGRLGRVGSRVTLTAPWYPLVVTEGDGYAHAVPHDVRVELIGRGRALLGDVLGEGVVEARRVAAFVPLVAAPRLFERVEDVAGLRLRVIGHREGYRLPSSSARGLARLEDLVLIDVVANVARVVEESAETARVLGVPVPEELTVAIVPSRTELAATAGSLVLLSDRAYEVAPTDLVRAFHDRALRRALFRSFAAPTASVDAAADRPWAQDLRAVVFADLDEVRRQGRVRTPEELLGWAGFHPAVDQLLYAPQLAFVDVFFGSVHEPDPYRDAPARARFPYARGRRLLEHARDLLDDEQFETFAAGLVAGQISVRAALAAAGGEEAVARLEVWLRSPALEVNYALGAVHSERLADGRYEHLVEVFRHGADRPEPVEVAIRDTDGEVEVGIWHGEGDRGEVTIVTDAPRHSVQVDPRRRLPQSADVADGHPLRDDTDHLPYRPPILQSFAANYNATDGIFSGVLDFAVRRRYDLENSIGLRLSTDARSTGGVLRLGRGFGPKRDNNSRVAGGSVGLQFDRLRAGFITGSEGGYRVALLAGVGFNTRRYFIDPRQGSSASASGRIGVVAEDSGSVSVSGAFGFRANHTLGIGTRNVFLFVLGGSAVFGDPQPGERPGLGGPFLLRGYEANEVIGDQRLFAVVEHRWTPLADLSWNLLHVAWLREIQLAAWAGAGVVRGSIDERGVVYGAEVGVGARLHYDYGGVQPALLTVDLGVPLVRSREARAARPGVSFLLAFAQYF